MLKGGEPAGVTFKLRVMGTARRRRRRITKDGTHGHWGSFNRKYFSKRLSKLFTHFVRRQKNLSAELIIGKIVAMKESDAENENGSNGTKYL